MVTPMKIAQQLFTCVLIAIVLIAQPAGAAEKKDRALREAQRRMEVLKQQMEAEKTALQAKLQEDFDKEKAQLQDQVSQKEKSGNALRKSLAAAKKQNEELTQELETLRKEKNELEAAKLKTDTELETTKTTLATTSKTLATTQQDLNVNEIQRKELAKLLAQREKWVLACSEKNDKLHGFGLDLIKVYEDSKLYTEPFIQRKRVEMENILEKYRDKLDEQITALSAPPR